MSEAEFALYSKAMLFLGDCICKNNGVVSVDPKIILLRDGTREENCKT